MGKNSPNKVIKLDAEAIARLAGKAPADPGDLTLSFEIKSALLDSMHCKYSYEVTAGKLKGDTINRVGASIVHEDLIEAFRKLNIHLAIICEDINGEDIPDVDDIAVFDPENDEHEPGGPEWMSKVFHVHAIKMSGSGDGESIILIGTKELKTLEHLELKTPRKRWDDDYPYIMELRAAVDKIREEVELYMQGKTAPVMEQAKLELPEGGEPGDPGSLD